MSKGKMEINLCTMGEVIDNLYEGEIAIKILGEDCGSKIYINKSTNQFRIIKHLNDCPLAFVYIEGEKNKEWVILREDGENQ